MSLEKAIEHKKEKRKPYYGSKAIDATCRNHGTCPACSKSRKVKELKRLRAKDNGTEPEEECLSDMEHYAFNRFFDIIVNMEARNSV